MQAQASAEAEAVMGRPFESDWPLHVKVAWALGCDLSEDITLPPESRAWSCNCGSWEHAEGGEASDTEAVARYDTDWSATGPLIEKYGIAVYPHRGMDAHADEGWNASRGSWADFVTGETPLIAVCNLILALKKAGKL